MTFDSVRIRSLLAITFLLAGIYFSPNARGISETGFTINNQRADSATFYDWDYAVHSVNKLIFVVTNTGGLAWGVGNESTDLFQGYSGYNGTEYPKGTGLSQIGVLSVWVGASRDGEAGVSTGYDYALDYHQELGPPGGASGTISYRSIIDPTSSAYQGAISEEDYYCTYADTFPSQSYQWVGNDEVSHRPHTPLGIEISQSSHAWSYGYIEDIVFLDFSVKNIGSLPLRRAYFGLMGSASHGTGGNLIDDNVCGIFESAPTPYFPTQCQSDFPIEVMWTSDADGDPHNGVFTNIPYQIDYGSQTITLKSNRHASGIEFVSASGELDFITTSFNWWNYIAFDPSRDYGPQLKESVHTFAKDNYGTPHGDEGRYYMMQNGEHDFPSVYTATIPEYDLVWTKTKQTLGNNIADGTWINYLYSLGPFDIDQGESIDIVVAIVAGENFHLYPNNGDNLPYNPQQWMKNVDFSDLAKNALWAQWVYDNPGVDTDGDGYRGEYHACVTDSQLINGQWTVAKAETTYYRGDGIPDWKGASAPPAPKVWVEPLLNGVRVRWNGSRSEGEKDPFLQAVDFEGYHVYFGRDNREASLQLIANYDRQNYDKHVFIPVPQDSGLWETSWEIQNIPFTLEELRCLYGNSCYDSSFDPETYTITNTYRYPNFPDSIFYFTKHDFNTSRLGVDTDIKKVYPDARDPSTVHPDSLTPDDYTADSLLKFYEYELVIPNLLPSVNYFASVTAYDFGSPPSGLQALETSKMADIKTVYPYINPGDEDEASRKVYIYPNPYRIDAGYRADGLESRGRDEDYVDRVKQVHFNNLPHKCTIRVFTLDGDLIREIDHDKSPDDPTAHHDTFSLINRNGMIIVTGLYYWTVESPDSKVQIGKLVVIM